MSVRFHLDIGFIIAQIHKTSGFVGSILHTPITCHLNIGVNMKALIEAYAAAIAAIAKRKTLTDTRHALAEVERQYGRGTCYGYTPNTKAAFVEYCQLCIVELVELAHAEALEINAEFDFAAHIETTAPHGYELLTAECTEAIEINAQVDAELCKLARVIAGVNRSTYKHETKAQLIGAACAGVVDGLRERMGVVLSRDRLAENVTRAVEIGK